MSEAWIPIIFTALIVFGVVGGQLAHTVLTRLLPLLETYLKKMPHRRDDDDAALTGSVHHLEERVSLLESRGRALWEQVSFLESGMMRVSSDMVVAPDRRPPRDSGRTP